MPLCNRKLDERSPRVQNRPVLRRFGVLGSLLALFATQSACSVDTEEEKRDPNAVKIGALLPFTGELAAEGANIERAILWAAEEVNKAGGVASGRHVEVIARDSNSSVERGMESARELIEDQGVIAIIGPQYEELAKEMVPLITEKQVINISGGVTSPIFTDLDTENLWFRTTPSSEAFGSVLADTAYKDKVRRLAILYVSDEYGRGFSSALRDKFLSYGNTTVELTPFASGQASYRETLAEVIEYEPDGIALVAYPRSGATIVSDWSTLGRDVNWYFSNTLRADEFVQNVPPDTIEGMTGTSHSLPPGDETVFRGHFGDRWPGDVPLPASFFNYDAAAVLLLAIEEAAIEYDTDDVPSAEQIAEHMELVSATSRGKTVPWHDIALGLDLVRYKNVPAYAGINYRGVSGFVDLDEHGDIFTGLVQLWTVDNGRVVGGETVTPELLSDE